MNTYTVVLLLETGQLRTLNVMAPTMHEARRIVTDWIGKRHPDATALVSLAGHECAPAPAAPAPAPVLAAMLAAAMLLLLLVHILLNH